MRRSPILLVLLTVPIMAGKSAPPPVEIPACGGNAQSSSNFGCANEGNLRAMVADQRDLIRGRDTGGTDAILEAAAVNRLRADKVKKLRSNSTLTTAPAGGE